MDIPLSEKISLSIREAMALTGICRDAIYKTIWSGALKAKKRGKSTIIRAADLHDWINGLPDYVTTVDSEPAPAAPAPAPARTPKRRLHPPAIALHQ